MSVQTENVTSEDKSIHFQTPTREHLGFDLSIYLLEIVIKIGRHFPIILLSSASINIILAANDFLANSLTFAIVNLIFAGGNFVFLVQLHNRKKTIVDERSFVVNSQGEIQ